jgi:branched-chain amino acid transport system substrate-binding protein
LWLAIARSHYRFSCRAFNERAARGGGHVRTLGACALAVLALGVAGCERKKAPQASAGDASSGAPPPPASDHILIGHVASLSGAEARFGQSTDHGVRLAVNEQNARGGVKGRVVEVRTLDDQGKPEEAAVAATRLASQEHVNVLIGEVASSRSLAMAPVADAYQVPMISPSSTSPGVTKDGERTRPYVFRVCFIDPFQGMVMARFARESLKLDRVAILRDAGNDYSVGLAEFFGARFKELGGAVVDDDSYKAGDQDFKAQLTRLNAHDPQAVYVPGRSTDVALIARQARELGMKQPLLGGDGWDSAKLFEIGGKAVEGSFFSNHYSHEDPSPRIREFVKRYTQAWGEVPDGLAAMGYDAARVAMDAAARAGELGGAALKDALASTKGFAGVTGVITIDQDHNAVKPAVVLEVKNGAARYVTTVKP